MNNKQRKDKVNKRKKSEDDNQLHGTRGLAHAYKSQGECSKRTRFFKEILDKGGSDAIKNKRRIDGIGTTVRITDEHSKNFETFVNTLKKEGDDNTLYFSGKTDLKKDAHILEDFPRATLVGLLDSKTTEITLYDDPVQNNGGIVCIDDTSKQIVFILVPRKMVCGQHKCSGMPKPSEYLKALDELESVKQNQYGERGKQRSMAFEKNADKENYQCIGKRADRGGKGLIEHIPPKLHQTKQHKDIFAWKKYVSSIVEKVVPLEIKEALRNALIGIGLNTNKVTQKSSSKDNKIGETREESGEYLIKNQDEFDSVPKLELFPSLAVSRNVALSMHTDHDASLSVVIVYRKEDINHRSNPECFVKNTPVLKYFTFGCGKSVGLRSGDMLIFNPQVKHCISTNTDDCHSTGVMTTSHYFKSNIIGLNDNSILFNDDI